MDLKQIVVLVFQVSIISTVFGFGLKTRSEDLLYILRRPGLLMRSLLAVFVIMPVVVVALTRMFHFSPTLEIAMVALALSPVPPLLPKKEAKVGDHGAFVLGLMAILALLSLVTIPASLEVLARLSGRHLVAPGSIVPVVLRGALAPLAAGMIFRAVLPTTAKRLEKRVTLVGKVLMAVAVLTILPAAIPAMWTLIGNGTLIAILLFVVAGLGIGHMLGGPSQNNSMVLALATACRHPAIALAIATANFPDQHFAGAILLYLIVNAIVGALYLNWQRRHVSGALRAA